MSLRCPACQTHIPSRSLRTYFSCSGCGARLSSNVRLILAWAIVVSVALEIILLWLLYSELGSFLKALFFGLLFAAFFPTWAVYSIFFNRFVHLRRSG